MTASAARMRTAFTSGGSFCARRATAFSAMSATPALEQVDQEEGYERDRQDDDRDVGLERHVPRDEHHRAVLPERAREREREARDERRGDRRHDHAEKGLQPVRAETRRRLLDVGVEPLEHRLKRADDERESDEDENEHDSEPRIGTLDAERHQEATVPAL